MKGMKVPFLFTACLVITPLIQLEVGASSDVEGRFRSKGEEEEKSLTNFLRQRRDSYSNNRDLYYNNNDNNDDGNGDANGDDVAADDDGNGGNYDDAYDDQVSQSFKANSLCTEYLFSFLKGSTDAKDNCEGIQNAYVSAYCSTDAEVDYKDDDHDDYFVSYNHISCCQSLKSHYDAYCDESEIITNMHLLLIASVLLLCEMAKSLIKTHKIHWIPEAGGCILVGTLTGLLAHITPLVDLDDEHKCLG